VLKKEGFFAPSIVNKILDFPDVFLFFIRILFRIFVQ